MAFIAYVLPLILVTVSYPGWLTIHQAIASWEAPYTGKMSPAILVRDLRKSYGLKAAVDGLDLEFPRGSFFGFLGPNGAGKSTTIPMLTGLIPADSGTIEVLGFKLPGDELEIKKRIGLVPEESLL